MTKTAVFLLCTLAAAGARAGYLPDQGQRSIVEARLEAFGKPFPGGFMLQIGRPGAPGEAAYFYKFGSGLIHWRLEEWTALPDGSLHLFLWRFYEGRANRGDYVIHTDGTLDMREFEEPMDPSSPGVTVKSEAAWRMFLTGEPNRDPFPSVGDH